MGYWNTMHLLMLMVAFNIVAAIPFSGGIMLRPRAPKVLSEIDSPSALENAFSGPQMLKRDERSISLDRAWFDEVLFSYGEEQNIQQTDISTLEYEAGISVTCNTCYIKGTAIARIIAENDFDASQEFQYVIDQVEDEISNLTDSAVNAVRDFFDDDEQDSFVIDTDFNIELPELPKCHLQFQFDGMELYMDLSASFYDETTYTLNLYSSKSPVGISVGDQEIGIIFTIDLILGVKGQIDINSGFHIRLNDGIQIDIGLFEQKLSSVTLTGGDFEFLPVTLNSASVTMTAALQVGIHAGLAIDPNLPGLTNELFGAGAEAGVFANIAELITEVTANSDDDDNDCDLSARQTYQIALGAAAGASVFVDDFTWGPTPETETPIWGTTLAQVCAFSGTLTTSPSVTTSGLKARDDDEEESTYTVVGCKTPGLSNCPVSAQTTFTATTTKPVTIQNTIVTPIPFGSNAKAVTVTAGKPSSFSPTPTRPVNGSGIAHVSNHDVKLIVGISVGVGVPFLLAIIAGCFCFYRRKKCRDESSPQTMDLKNGVNVNTRAI